MYGGNIPQITEFETVANSLPRSLRKVHKWLISNLFLSIYRIFIENFDGIRQNLRDKGYNIDLLETETFAESGTIQTTLPYTPSETDQERNLITGLKGEIIVFEKLKEMGYAPKCPSISSENDYDRIIEMNGKVLS